MSELVRPYAGLKLKLAAKCASLWAVMGSMCSSLVMLERKELEDWLLFRRDLRLDPLDRSMERRPK